MFSKGLSRQEQTNILRANIISGKKNTIAELLRNKSISFFEGKTATKIYTHRASCSYFIIVGYKAETFSLQFIFIYQVKLGSNRQRPRLSQGRKLIIFLTKSLIFLRVSCSWRRQGLEGDLNWKEVTDLGNMHMAIHWKITLHLNYGF